jgi:hypothetical protein
VSSTWSLSSLRNGLPQTLGFSADRLFVDRYR